MIDYNRKIVRDFFDNILKYYYIVVRDCLLSCDKKANISGKGGIEWKGK
jgi:hypothetical protein